MWRTIRPDSISVLNNRLTKRTLRRYFSVMLNKKPAKFTIATKIAAEFSRNESTETLWKKHKDLVWESSRIEREIDCNVKNLSEMPTPKKSFLDLKIEIANRILSACHFCKRRCGINRLEGELGYCKCGSKMTVSSIFEHMGEEPELVPSGTIFTMGCNMKCRHCQNWAISQWKERGKLYNPEELAKRVEWLRSNGCRNINLVGGEPTPWLQQWLKTFRHANVNVPVVWNSNSYYSLETADLLAGFVDVYLLDFKYGKDKCAEEISEAPDYWKTCVRNHLRASGFGEIITRILVLPNHLECCTRPIINWIAKNLGQEARVNIMFQYRPEWRALETVGLSRRLSRDEVKRAIELAKEAKLVNFIT